MPSYASEDMVLLLVDGHILLKIPILLLILVVNIMATILGLGCHMIDIVRSEVVSIPHGSGKRQQSCPILQSCHS
jgi:hypothetical protein